MLAEEEARAKKAARCAKISMGVAIPTIVTSLVVIVLLAFRSPHLNKFVWSAASAYGRPSGIDGRIFLHIADTHADPFYDYTQFFLADPKISRSPALFSKTKAAAECGYDTIESILEHWNRTGGGPQCPCGQFGANPPFNVIKSLREEIEQQKPEFVIWSGDFASHYEPGTKSGDTCFTAKAAAMASVTMLNAPGIEHMWVWGNNDVLPKREPLTQSWLEMFGAHLRKEGWLKEDEMDTWNKGGFYRRNLGKGLCVINLNSNSWTQNQINEKHNAAQIQWFGGEAFHSDSTCDKYLINAHVPLGWLESGSGHHQWNNLAGAEVPEYSKQVCACVCNGVRAQCRPWYELDGDYGTMGLRA